MGALDFRRCRHCARPVTTITPHEDDEFVQTGPACMCVRCDRHPHPEDATFVPDGWE